MEYKIRCHYIEDEKYLPICNDRFCMCSDRRIKFSDNIVKLVQMQETVILEYVSDKSGYIDIVVNEDTYSEWLRN